MTVENPEVVLATVVCECFLAQIAVELAGFADFDCYQANENDKNDSFK